MLLAALPTDDRDRLVPTLDVIPLKLKDLLHKPGEHVDYVYFPGGGFLSIVTVLEDGSMVEVATIGREGVLGVTAVRPVTSVIPRAWRSLAVSAEIEIGVSCRLSAR